MSCMKQLDAGDVTHVAAHRPAPSRRGVRHPAEGHLYDDHPTGPRPANLRLEDVCIRPFGHRDGERIRRMSRLLSGQSLYRRFFSGTPEIPALYVRHLQGMDHWNHDALVALYDDDVVGIAEYVRDRDDPGSAELAVLVADPWQRHGLGRHLVGYLVELAARRGITVFDAEVMPGNTGAISALRSAWPSVRPYTADGSARFELPLRRPA